MKTMLCLLSILLLAPLAAHAETPASDPMAVAVADKVMKALGGREAWAALPCIRWSFGSEVNDTVRSTRRHAWNMHTGWHRVEGRNRAGQDYVMIHRIGETTGRAWVNGTPLEGDSLDKMTKLAQSLWTNDSYWFLMPYKLRDPGVTLKHEGQVTEGDRAYDKIALTFENVGETPGDHYWVYVDRASGRVEKWDMVLQGDAPPPQTYTWEGWEEHDGLWFPTAHRRENRNVFTRDIVTSQALPPETFERP